MIREGGRPEIIGAPILYEDLGLGAVAGAIQEARYFYISITAGKRLYEVGRHEILWQNGIIETLDDYRG